MIKENEETILQLGANMRISCLQPDLFAVHEAMLETLCLCSYILFHTFSKRTFFNFSHTPLLQTLTITDTKCPKKQQLTVLGKVTTDITAKRIEGHSIHYLKILILTNH